MNYLNNEDVLNELLKCQEKGECTNEMANIVKIMHTHIFNYGNQRYSDATDDYLQDVYIIFLKRFKKFDKKRSESAFAWLTSMIRNSHIMTNIKLNHSMSGSINLYRQNKAHWTKTKAINIPYL